MWATIITLAIQLIGMGIKKKSNDDETNKKFLELATHLQAKKLVSANMKIERTTRLERLKSKTEQET